ncbi:MAG: hypothetical protein ABGU93_06915 [Acetobacterium sp.]|uniref:hypothetical protein n=1 Tax=Acetobacterium sp. TaxID=1872094 RepID=UPI003242A6F8
MAKITDKTAAEKIIERQLELRRKLDGAYNNISFPSSHANDSMFRSHAALDIAGIGVWPVNMGDYPSSIALAGSWFDDAMTTSAFSMAESPMIKMAYENIQFAADMIYNHAELLDSISLSSNLSATNSALSELFNNSDSFLKALIDDLPEDVNPENYEIIKNVASDVKTIKENSHVSIYDKLTFIITLLGFLISLYSTNLSDLESVVLKEFLDSTSNKLEQFVDIATDYVEQDIALHQQEIKLDKERNDLLQEQNEILKKQHDPIKD